VSNGQLNLVFNACPFVLDFFALFLHYIINYTRVFEKKKAMKILLTRNKVY